MTKRSGVRSLIAFSALLVLIACIADATESDPKEATTPTKKTEPDADLKLAPPVTEKAEEDKKAKEETKEKTELDEPKETVSKKKDEILGEVEPQLKNEEGSVDGGSHVEECDPTNRCIDEKSNLVACLRVPGEDLLDLSLLIQNKGKAPLEVKIMAPAFVSLEQNSVQLRAKDNAEVKVSVKDRSGNDTEIVLQVGEGSCRLDFQNMVSDSVKNSETTTIPEYSDDIPIQTHVMFVILLVLGGMALWWFGIRNVIVVWRERRQHGGPKYQLRDGLPISTGGKKDNNEADGWDNSWGDDWDDEEAPTTPSKPVTSFKGLASRKGGKDSWNV